MMSKILKSTLLGALAVFFIAGSAMAVPFNDRSTPIVPVDVHLQATLNGIMSNPWDVVDDQSTAAVFTNSGSAGSVASFVFTDWGTTEGHEFGIYKYGDIDNTLQIFGSNMGDSDQVTVTFFEGGNVRASGYTEGNDILYDYAYDFGSTFGFYYTTQNSTYYTEDDLNNGAAMALTYQGNTDQYLDIPGNLAGGFLSSSHWLIAFDGTSYLDYNDAVVLVESIAPVPEPATLLLLGSGLVGLAFLKRRKS